MNSSESAEEVVKLSLEGLEVVARITGAGTSRIATLIYNKAKEKKMTKGKTNLNNMLRSGRNLQIFSLQDGEQLKIFHQEAKKYGVLYTAIVPKKKNKDGLVDIMVRAEDAPKVNRIVEKFKLSSVDITSIRSEIEKDKMEEMLKDANERGIPIKSYEEKLAEDLLAKPIKKEENENANPQLAKTVKDPQSEPSSKNKKNLGVVDSKNNRPSVRETLKEIKEEQKLNSDSKENIEKSTKSNDKSMITPAKTNVKKNKNRKDR